MPRFSQSAANDQTFGFGIKMETGQIKLKLTDLSERTTALRGYL